MFKTPAIAVAVTVILAGLAGLAGPADGDTLTRVIADGVFHDWSAVPVAFTDPTGDHSSSVADIRNVWLANDADFVYVRFEVGSLLHQDEVNVNIYFDIDSNDATGYSVRDRPACSKYPESDSVSCAANQIGQHANLIKRPTAARGHQVG